MNNSYTDYQKFFDDYMDRLQKRAEVAVRKALVDTNKEYLRAVEKDMRGVFRSAINDFYSDYTPQEYRRTYSLYNLLETRLDESDEDDIGLVLSFNPSNMSSYRNGYAGDDGLYDLVFRQGWHGGADKIASEKEFQWGVHPSPGTPYYRKPQKAHYPHWGRRAERANVSPLSDIQSQVEEYQGTVNQALFNQIFNKHISKIKL